jgi:hypothetical protein
MIGAVVPISYRKPNLLIPQAGLARFGRFPFTGLALGLI